MTDAPTLGEAIRRLADITVQLTDITTQLRTDFVRKETYNAHRDATKAAFDNINDDITELKKDQAWRRSTSVAVAIAGIGWFLTIVGLIVAVVMKV